jgi:multiple sugar transport system substrate-binding protein
MTDDGPVGRRLDRRQLLRGAAGAGLALGLAPTTAYGSAWRTFSTQGERAGGSINIGSFADNALAPLRSPNGFFARFTKETGIKINYKETDYNTWYTNAKNDGLNKTGAYDIYIMDDNWVPEFAAGKIVQNLDALGFKANPNILPKGLQQGLWPPKVGPRLKDFKNDKPALYAIVIIDDVEILYYNKKYFPKAPKTWDDIARVAKAKSRPPKLYGWSARGVKGNPIVQTYLPLMSSYGANFMNNDWSPGFNSPAGVAALERLFSFIPYMPKSVAAYDTNQEIQVLLQGKCTALTEYTGTVHVIDDPKASRVVGQINCAATPSQEKSGPAIGTFICGIASGAPNTAGAVQFLEWFTSDKIQNAFALAGGSAAVTGKALRNPAAVKKYRWLPAIADAVNSSVPKPRTPDEPKMEDILGTHLNEAFVTAIAQKKNYHATAKSALNQAAKEITSYLKQQGGYY